MKEKMQNALITAGILIIIFLAVSVGDLIIMRVPQSLDEQVRFDTQSALSEEPVRYEIKWNTPTLYNNEVDTRYGVYYYGPDVAPTPVKE